MIVILVQDDDEADTVGCCTLKVENVALVPPNKLEVWWVYILLTLSLSLFSLRSGCVAVYPKQ